jgi:hypothetical protein
VITRSTSAPLTPIAVAKYFDDVVDELGRRGITVATVTIDIVPREPVRGQLVTGSGPVLRWREDMGWSTGPQATGPAAHPEEVARLLVTGPGVPAAALPR